MISSRFRRVIPLLLLASVLAVACQPAKKAAPPPSQPLPPGTFIAYYYASDNQALTGPKRSVTPFTRTLFNGGTASQALMADGSVGLDVSGAGVGNIRAGFYTVSLRLGDISSIHLGLGSNTDGVDVELFLDVNGDGEFGVWNAAGDQTSMGGDKDAINGNFPPPMATGLSLVIDDTTTYFINGGGGNRTLGQLKAGAEPGVTADTRVAILVSVHILGPEPAASALVNSLRVNGFELLVP